METKDTAKEIEKIYQEYIEKIAELRKEQNRLVDDFTIQLEEVKKKEIMNNINN